MALPAATIHGAKQLAKWYIKRRAKKKLKKGVVKKTGAVMAYGGAEHKEAEGFVGKIALKGAKKLGKKLGKTGKGKQVALGAVSASSASGPILEARKRYKDHKRLKRTGVMSPAQEKRFKKKMKRTMKRQTKEWGQEERALKGKPKNVIEKLRAKTYKKRRRGKKKQAEYWRKDTEKSYKMREKWAAPIGGDTEAGRKDPKVDRILKRTRRAIEQRKNIKGFVSTLKKTAKKKPAVKKKKTKMRGKEPSLYFYTK